MGFGVTMIEMECLHCGVKFEKAIAIVNDAAKRGMNIYCSLLCSGLGRRTAGTAEMTKDIKCRSCKEVKNPCMFAINSGKWRRRVCKDCRRRRRHAKWERPVLNKREKFKPILGTDGIYEIGSFGTLKSFGRDLKDRKKFEVKKSFVGYKGYVYVYLKMKGVAKIKKVHRLVALHFVPNSFNKPQVNHIDGDKTNNKVKNLEWVTNSENQKHAFAIGLECNKGINSPTHKLSEAQVIAIFNSLAPTKELVKEYNVVDSTIIRIRSGKTWTHLKKVL